MKYLDLHKGGGVINRRGGFTIVELLIVIVVIGILAAISVVAYNGIRDRTNDTVVRQDLANLAKKFEIFSVENSRYPTTDVELGTLDFTASKGSYYTSTNGTAHAYNLVPCILNSGAEYSVAAISTSGKRYYITNGSSVREYTGTDNWPSYPTMCSTTLPGSSVITYGSGYANRSVWRSWVN